MNLRFWAFTYKIEQHERQRNERIGLVRNKLKKEYSGRFNYNNFCALIFKGLK